ncbi:caspase, EACC1-associated type [Streptosporangium sp. KLBMP 9127]|nr:caspase family protein [Streptosporangium sp. KLBMP 9127]
MKISNVDSSYAILIGTSLKEAKLELPALKAVEQNLEDLGRILTDKEVLGLPEQNCLHLFNREDPKSILREVSKIAKKATGMLLVYFAGHGAIVPPGRDLYFALKDIEDFDEGLRYASLQKRICRRFEVYSNGTPIRDFREQTIVILDCCYSGAASVATSDTDALDGSASQGSCMLTASSATRVAMAFPGEKYTEFTGEIIRVLRDGVPGRAQMLTPGDIYREVSKRVKRRREVNPGVPFPSFKSYQQGSEMPFVRNRGYTPIRDTST